MVHFTLWLSSIAQCTSGWCPGVHRTVLGIWRAAAQQRQRINVEQPSVRRPTPAEGSSAHLRRAGAAQREVRGGGPGHY